MKQFPHVAGIYICVCIAAGPSYIYVYLLWEPIEKGTNKKGQKSKKGTKAWDQSVGQKSKKKAQKRGAKAWDKNFKARDKSVEQKRATKACHPSKTEILDGCKNDQKPCVLLHKVNSSHGLVPRIGPTDWFLFFEIPSLFLRGQLVPFLGLFGSFFASLFWFLCLVPFFGS